MIIGPDFKKTWVFFYHGLINIHQKGLLLPKEAVLAFSLISPNITRSRLPFYLLITPQDLYKEVILHLPTDPEELVFSAVAAIHKFSLVPSHQTKPHEGRVLSKSGMVPDLEADRDKLKLQFSFHQ